MWMVGGTSSPLDIPLILPKPARRRKRINGKHLEKLTCLVSKLIKNANLKRQASTSLKTTLNVYLCVRKRVFSSF